MKRHKQLPKYTIHGQHYDPSISGHTGPSSYSDVSPTCVAVKFFIESKTVYYLLHFHINQNSLKLAMYYVIKETAFN